MTRTLVLSVALSSILSSLITLGVVGLTRPASARAQPTVLQARAFELVDSAGTPRGEFASQANGTIGLFLNDAKGVTRIATTIGADGTPMITLSDANASPRAYFSLTGDAGLPVLAFAQPGGQVRTQMSDGTGDMRGLSFYDASANVVWSAP